MRLGAASLSLGAWMHIAMVDLGLAIEPRLGSGDRASRRLHPWRGVVVIVLLTAGLAFMADVAITSIHWALPRREVAHDTN